MARKKTRTNDSHRISLYEDIYSIVTLKEREANIFANRSILKRSIQEIALYTNRSNVTIDERIRKKLHQLTAEQLSYLIQTNQDIVFRPNSKIINTDNWPEHLKIPY
jgi:hypothetical protein